MDVCNIEVLQAACYSRELPYLDAALLKVQTV